MKPKHHEFKNGLLTDIHTLEDGSKVPIGINLQIGVDGSVFFHVMDRNMLLAFYLDEESRKVLADKLINPPGPPIKAMCK